MITESEELEAKAFRYEEKLKNVINNPRTPKEKKKQAQL
jgi:hypothetical protein